MITFFGILFILSAITPCTTELKALCDHLTAQVQPKLSSYLQDKGLRITIYQRSWSSLACTGERTQWQRTALLSSHPCHYVSVCAWIWTHVFCVPRRVCYTLGHSGRLRCFPFKQTFKNLREKIIKTETLNVEWCPEIYKCSVNVKNTVSGRLRLKILILEYVSYEAVIKCSPSWL